MVSLLPLLFIACTTTPPPPPPPDGVMPEAPVRTGPATDVVPLHLRLDTATLELADHNLPDGQGLASTFTFDLDAHRRGKRAATVPMPFDLDAAGVAAIGRDLEVLADGEPLSYASLGGAGNSWQLIRGKLHLRIPPDAKTLTIRHLRPHLLVKRRVLSASGLGPAAFLTDAYTNDGYTEHGLTLTTPSSATWTIDVPKAQPRFKATLTLQDLGHGTGGDGADVSLLLEADGDRQTLATRTVTPGMPQPWQVDLTPWAGRQVALSLITEPRANADYDYVFVGSPTVWGAQQAPRRVLVIGLDTTRPDHFGWFGYDRPTTPELDAIADTSAVMMQAWCPAPRTRPSFRSATTGRDPLAAVGATNIGEVFQRHGFATAGFVANIHLQPRFGFDRGFERWHFDGQANASDQVDRALGWFQEHADRDAYMFLHIMDPHLPYGAPGEHRDVFVDDPDPDLPAQFFRNQVYGWMRDGALDQRRREHIIGLYDGELRYTSRQVGRLIDALDAMPGQTLVVIHSDHGEELFEHGGFEHNHTLYDETTRAVLLFRPPGGTVGGAIRVQQPATLADIAPTLYDFLGFEDVPPTDGISLRPFMQGRPPGERDIGIAHLRYGHDRWGVVHRGHKYVIWTHDGREELYDLRRDPGEREDLAASKDLAPFREALRGAHADLELGPGWRIGLSGLEQPITLPLPADALGAAAYDPHEIELYRPNLSWGEPRTATPEDVATVRVEGRELHIEPGGHAGLVWVRFATPQPPPTSVRRGDATVALDDGDGGAKQLGGAKPTLRVTAGQVLVPPPGEASRIAALQGATDDASTEDTCELCQLGYIEGPSCARCE